MHNKNILATLLPVGFIFYASNMYADNYVCDNKLTTASITHNTQLLSCNGWYAGIGLGVSSIKPRVIDLPETLDKTRDIVLPTIYAGYDINRFWSLEAHLSNQGAATFDSGAAIDYSHVGASVLYHFSTHLPGWNTYAKLGVSQLTTSLGEGRDDGGEFNFEQLEGTQVNLGVGVEYIFDSMWGVRLEALSIDTDSNELTFSILKRFGRNVSKVKPKEVVFAPVIPVAVAPTPVLVEPQPKEPKPVICDAPEGVVDGIYFVTSSAQITPQSQQVLDAIVSDLQPFKNIAVAIRAHTDDRGSASYNLRLSQRRAFTVQNYLQSQGINNVQSEGLGETQPVDDNSTKEGRAKNRRVEIEILSGECDD